MRHIMSAILTSPHFLPFGIFCRIDEDQSAMSKVYLNTMTSVVVESRSKPERERSIN